MDNSVEHIISNLRKKTMCSLQWLQSCFVGLFIVWQHWVLSNQAVEGSPHLGSKEAPAMCQELPRSPIWKLSDTDLKIEPQPFNSKDQRVGRHVGFLPSARALCEGCNSLDSKAALLFPFSSIQLRALFDLVHLSHSFWWTVVSPVTKTKDWSKLRVSQIGSTQSSSFPIAALKSSGVHTTQASLALLRPGPGALGADSPATLDQGGYFCAFSPTTISLCQSPRDAERGREREREGEERKQIGEQKFTLILISSRDEQPQLAT